MNKLEIEPGMAIQVELKNNDFIMVNGVVVTNLMLHNASFIQNEGIFATENHYFQNRGFYDFLARIGEISLYISKMQLHLRNEKNNVSEILESIELISAYAESMLCPEELRETACDMYKSLYPVSNGKK